jgi:hypothetical protein
MQRRGGYRDDTKRQFNIIDKPAGDACEIICDEVHTY